MFKPVFDNGQSTTYSVDIPDQELKKLYKDTAKINKKQGHIKRLESRKNN